MNKKVLVIVPDGVSLRNFVFTDFPMEARKAGLEIIYWNATAYDITAEGEKEIPLKPHPRAITDLYKRAKILAELNHFKERFKDPVYDNYRFAASKKGWKNKVKNLIVSQLVNSHTGEEGLQLLRSRMQKSEKKSAYYRECISVLEKEKPDIVFCTNQRPVNAIAPVMAAQELGIPTACFIFSWDNLPKATKVIDTDHYFVWSGYMKKELLNYYPYISEEQVKVTGTPQFEIHYKDEFVLSRESFFKKYDLDPERSYLCFSGDDVTTSPHDEIFLKDVAEAVRKLNQGGATIGIIFRRCPVDFSDRYNEVLSAYPQEVTAINPLWNGGNVYWDQAMPTREDMVLQTNIIAHSFMVINVGSSMVFDFAAKEKSCAYLNYLPEVKNLKKNIQEVYAYVHFNSMPDHEPVFWINRKEDIINVLEKHLQGNTEDIIRNAQKWFYIVNNYTETSSGKISKVLDNLPGK